MWDTLGKMPVWMSRALDYLNVTYPPGDPARKQTHESSLAKILAEMDE